MVPQRAQLGAAVTQLLRFGLLHHAWSKVSETSWCHHVLLLLLPVQVGEDTVLGSNLDDLLFPQYAPYMVQVHARPGHPCGRWRGSRFSAAALGVCSGKVEEDLMEIVLGDVR